MTPGDALRLIAQGFAAWADATDTQAFAASQSNVERLTLRQASRRSGVSVKGLRKAIASGQLPASRPGREYLIAVVALTEWLQQHAAVPRPVKRAAAAQAVPDDADIGLAKAFSRGTLRVVKGR